MADSKLVEKPLLEKIQDLLERKPETYDVSFCVGKEKKIVKALKVILKASSPVLEKQFEEEWETAVIKEGEGIPLPDFDPIAFELFVRLTSLDTWSLDFLTELKLKPNQLLDLLSICRRFQMRSAVQNLDILATAFMQSFKEYKDTEEFLQLSELNLKYVLARDDIEVKELEVFNCAMRWADTQCKELEIDATDENVREALGECLFQIRFPIMSCTEFTEAIAFKNVLTAEEALEIYKLIGFLGSKKKIGLKLDTKKIPFKTIQRKQSLIEILPGNSTLYLTRGLKIVENPPFVCDNSKKYHYIECEKKITIYGLGFLGQIESDGFYDVKVQVHCKMLKKSIFAQKGKTFYFVFDTPIDLEAGSVSSWTKCYQISYYLKGANTFSAIRSHSTDLVLQEADTKFRLQWHSNQLAEILFKLSSHRATPHTL